MTDQPSLPGLADPSSRDESQPTTDPAELLGDGSSTRYWAAAFRKPDADRILGALEVEPEWRQESVTIAARVLDQPRLTAWQGDSGRNYRYSGLTLTPAPWSPAVREVRAVVEALAGVRFNSVLLNLYRSGADGVGWHADDEKQLGNNPVIGAASFGGLRRFILRRRDNHSRKVELLPEHGSVIVMSGRTQHDWDHQVPKTARPAELRVNLTFRVLS